jgi:ribosome maturation factor RimP
MNSTKSSTQKNLIQQRLKNALQSLTKIKSDLGIKKINNEIGLPAGTGLNLPGGSINGSPSEDDVNKMKDKLGRNKSVNEDIRRVKLLGIDFKVSEMNGRIFFSFVDKKAATVQLRQVGTNKIVNHIQKRLDIAFGKSEFFFKSGDHAEFQNGYLFQRNTSNINLNKIKFESVNEGLYHVGYNKGRGQGTGVFKDSYPSYKDAKKAVEKLEKERGGSYNTIAYYVSDKDGKIVKESVNESENFNGYVSSTDGKTFTLYNSDKKKIKDVSFDDLKNKYMKTYSSLKDFRDGFDKTTSKGKYFQYWKGKLVNVKLSNIDESINETTEPEVISQLRDIVKNQQYQSVKDPSSGKKMKVDMQTANIVLKIYDGLSNMNKQSMVKMGLPKMIDVSNKIISKYR